MRSSAPPCCAPPACAFSPTESLPPPFIRIHATTGSAKAASFIAGCCPPRQAIIRRGDNGTDQFNYSGIGGRAAAAALVVTYYPEPSVTAKVVGSPLRPPLRPMRAATWYWNFCPTSSASFRSCRSFASSNRAWRFPASGQLIMNRSVLNRALLLAAILLVAHSSSGSNRLCPRRRSPRPQSRTRSRNLFRNQPLAISTRALAPRSESSIAGKETTTGVPDSLLSALRLPAECACLQPPAPTSLGDNTECLPDSSSRPRES